MKYAQLVMGLLIGTAIGGAVVSANLVSVGASAGTAAPDADAVRQIVRDVIRDEAQLILDSVSSHQQKQQQQAHAASNEQLKSDPELREAVYNDPNSPAVGPKDAKNVIVEFFDYNCPACKSTFEGLDKLYAENKDVRIIFKEFPIFGPQSETNSKIGIAVHRIAPDKYFAFHAKMMGFEGRADEAQALKFVKDIGLNPTKVKAEAESPKVAEILGAERSLGGKLGVRGTPNFIINDTFTPSGMGYDQLVSQLKN